MKTIEQISREASEKIRKSGYVSVLYPTGEVTEIRVASIIAEAILEHESEDKARLDWILSLPGDPDDDDPERAFRTREQIDAARANPRK